MGWMELHFAAYNADIERVEELIARGDPVDARDESRYTPLLWSCFRGAVGDQLPVVRALLAAGADPNSTVNDDASCLIFAAQCGKVGLVEALVAAGADPNMDVDGVTPLMQAARDGDEDVIAALQRLGARAEAVINGFTAADYARYGGHDELAERLSM
jgi:ankyrin repeat protein